MFCSFDFLTIRYFLGINREDVSATRVSPIFTLKGLLSGVVIEMRSVLSPLEAMLYIMHSARYFPIGRMMDACELSVVPV